MKKSALFCLLLALSLCLCSCKSSDYKDAISRYEAGQYQQAKEIFIELGEYKDSAAFVKKCSYADAVSQYDAEQYQQAKNAFIALGEYEDAAEYVNKCTYGYAISLYQNKEYENAIAVFSELGDWSDSKEQIAACLEKIKQRDYNNAVDLLEKGETAQAQQLFLTMEDYKDSVYFLGVCLYEEEKYEASWDYFKQVPEDSQYKKDALQMEARIAYEIAWEYCLAHDWTTAKRYLTENGEDSRADNLLRIIKQVESDGMEGVYVCDDTFLVIQYELYSDYSTSAPKGKYVVIYQDKTTETVYKNGYMEDGKMIVYNNKDTVTFTRPDEHPIENAKYQLVPLWGGYGFRWDLAKITLQKTPDGIAETRLEEEYIGTYGDRSNQQKQTTKRNFTVYDCIVKKV